MKLATLFLLAIATPVIAQSKEFMVAMRKADLAVTHVHEHFYDMDDDIYVHVYADALSAVDNLTAMAESDKEKRIAHCEDFDLFITNQRHETHKIDPRAIKDEPKTDCFSQ
jgi:hypothetical protein